jgi:hypothetical protein
MASSYRFRPSIARRIPDPNFKSTNGAERHIFMMPAKNLPVGIPYDPNARRPNTNKRVYRTVEKSLLGLEGEPGTFHLKNKGITIIAESVKQTGEEYDVDMKTGIHGIVDGGHTYEIITTNLENPALSPDQYVTVEIRTGIPEGWIPDIAGGLNTSVQVQDMSLDNLKGQFEWIRAELKSASYAKEIAWSENDPGEYDARDLVSLLMMFNIELFPNANDEHPVAAYEKKSTALKLFENKGPSFERLRPILKDILVLHDTVASSAKDVWNKAVPGGKGGNLSFIETRKKGAFNFHFIGQKGDSRLMGGALYPILGAFRWYVDSDPTTLDMKWRGGFKSALMAWQQDGSELLKATKQMSDDLGRNPNAIGKSRPHWANLHTIVAKKDLMRRTA